MTAPPGQAVWIALATAPDENVAVELARLAVEAGHAACANLVGGVRSIYRWQGALEDEREVLIVFKTTAAAYPGLAELVAAHHPYEVPELVAFPLTAGLAPYLDWVRTSVAGSAGGGLRPQA